jgi:hypothetical protein
MMGNLERNKVKAESMPSYCQENWDTASAGELAVTGRSQQEITSPGIKGPTQPTTNGRAVSLKTTPHPGPWGKKWAIWRFCVAYVC